MTLPSRLSLVPNEQFFSRWLHEVGSN